MKYSRIFATGTIFLILTGIASAGNLILRIDVATQVDKNKIDRVFVECNIKNVHGRVIGWDGTEISLDSSGSYIGPVDIKIEPVFWVGGDADMLANAQTYECHYVVTTKREHGGRPIMEEADIPAGLEYYSGRGGRPFRPVVSGSVRW